MMNAFGQKITTMGLCLVAIVLVSCSKEDHNDPAGTAECWYSVTIDGQPMLPNKFGQDQVLITGGKDTESGEEVFAFGINQAKENTSNRASLIVLIHGLFNNQLPTGSYPANFFSSTGFSTPGLEQWPLYVVGDPGDDDHVEENLQFTLLENSKQRIRMKVAGMAMRMEENFVEAGLVPVEAEITVGRTHYVEANVEGNLIGGVICQCQE